MDSTKLFTGNLYTIVLSGGLGARMQSDRPKQFLELAGRPVLLHSLERFAAWRPDATLLVVAPEIHWNETRTLLGESSLAERQIPIAVGGASRHASALAGLTAALAAGAREAPGASEESLILFHDAARPLITADELDRLVEAFADPAVRIASLAAPVSETIVEAEALPGPLARTADRNRYFAIKTPQAGRISALLTMLERSEQIDLERGGAPFEYTDLLTWGEACGETGTLIAAGPANLKLTQPEDLPLLERLHATLHGH